MIYVTSDEHYGHSNIIGYCDRPFSTLLEMEEEIIRRHNEHVTHRDLVIHLGDFCFDKKRVIEILSQLNGTHWLIKGNHDRASTSFYQGAGFECVSNKLNFQGLIFSHRPLPGTHLHGHCHGTKQYFGKVDVGVDCHNYYPITLDYARLLLS